MIYLSLSAEFDSFDRMSYAGFERTLFLGGKTSWEWGVFNTLLGWSIKVFVFEHFEIKVFSGHANKL